MEMILEENEFKSDEVEKLKRDIENLMKEKHTHFS
jgi:hypothetical protein